jgi:hypothetical protein
MYTRELLPEAREELRAQLKLVRATLFIRLRDRRTYSGPERTQDLPPEQRGLDSGSCGCSKPTPAQASLLTEFALRSQLVEVERALAKFDTGRYGLCERCGLPIALSELRDIPWRRFDGQHQAILGLGPSVLSRA